MNKIIFGVLALVLSSVGIIYSKHISRKLFTELQQLQQKRDELHVEWTQLLLEEGAWATHARVDRVARERLNMLMPEPGQIKVIIEHAQ